MGIFLFSLTGGSLPQTRRPAPETSNRAFSAAVGSEVKTAALEVSLESRREEGAACAVR